MSAGCQERADTVPPKSSTSGNFAQEVWASDLSNSKPYAFGKAKLRDAVRFEARMAKGLFVSQSNSVRLSLGGQINAVIIRGRATGTQVRLVLDDRPIGWIRTDEDVSHNPMKVAEVDVENDYVLLLAMKWRSGNTAAYSECEKVAAQIAASATTRLAAELSP